MRFKISLAAVLFAGLAQSSFGSVITTGFFDFSGTVYVTNAQAGAVVTPAGTCPAFVACIFWQDPAGTSFGKADIATDSLPNGDIPFALAGNDAANVSSESNPTEVVGGAGFAPTTFMTFNNAGVTTDLLLDYIDPGVFTAAACGASPTPGQTCTLAGSLFSFTNNAPPPGQATAQWAFQGITNTPNVTWAGNFTSQFPLGDPYQTVFGQLSVNGYVSNTFSGTITLTTTSGTPEPASLGLMMIGLTGFLFLRRRLA